MCNSVIYMYHVANVHSSNDIGKGISRGAERCNFQLYIIIAPSSEELYGCGEKFDQNALL